MSHKKILERLLKEPSEMRIWDIIHLLEHYGFHLARVKGSHYIIESAFKTFVLPVHNNMVTKHYLKHIKLFLTAHGKKETQN